jgi:acetolactate synthase-1/2/3 large subunit
LERVLPDDAFLAADPGISAVYPAAFTRLAKAGRRTAYNFAMGSLGYAIPCAIGARAGIPAERPVVGLVGDGSFGFAAGELETAVREKLNITYILFDNATFGWIRGTLFVSGKTALSRHYDNFTDFAAVDYLKIADGFGLKSYAPKTLGDFEMVLKESISSAGPKLIVLKMDPEDKLLPPVPGWYKYAVGAGLENLFGAEGIPAAALM